MSGRFIARAGSAIRGDQVCLDIRRGMVDFLRESKLVSKIVN